MACLAYTHKIDLCFDNAVREFKNFGASPGCIISRDGFYLDATTFLVSSRAIATSPLDSAGSRLTE